jgi:hypothetical protein
LPAEFHSSKSFEQMLLTLKTQLKDSSVIDGGKIDSPLLLLGLAYREVARSIEIEPGAPTTAPDHLVNSTFSFL